MQLQETWKSQRTRKRHSQTGDWKKANGPHLQQAQTAPAVQAMLRMALVSSRQTRPRASSLVWCASQTEAHSQVSRSLSVQHDILPTSLVADFLQRCMGCSEEQQHASSVSLIAAVPAVDARHSVQPASSSASGSEVRREGRRHEELLHRSLDRRGRAVAHAAGRRAASARRQQLERQRGAARASCELRLCRQR